MHTHTPLKTAALAGIAAFMLITLPTHAGMKEAQQAEQAFKWDIALREYTAAAEQGNAAAQLRLARLYRSGIGPVPAERNSLALKWYRAAAALGSTSAQRDLGQALMFGSLDVTDGEEAARLLRALATQGDNDAQSYLASLYREGRLVKKDIEEARKWYQLLADRGLAQGQSGLADLYADGSLPSKDGKDAEKWWVLAAEGDRTNAYQLALAYTKGGGVAKDDKKAIQWLARAADAGHEAAYVPLGQAFETGRGVAANPAVAHTLYAWGAQTILPYMDAPQLHATSRDRVAATLSAPQLASAQNMLAALAHGESLLQVLKPHLLPLPAPIKSDMPAETLERAAISQAARKAFDLRQFDELERLAQAYRSDAERTSGGTPKMTLLYSGLQEAVGKLNPLPVVKNSVCSGPSINLIAPGPLPVEAVLQGWQDKHPQSKVAPNLLAFAYLNHAQTLRSTCVAQSVPKENWAAIEKYVSLSRQTLEKAQPSGLDPVWFQTMFDIARLQSWNPKDFSALLARLPSARPQLIQPYLSAAIYLLPQWHGSIDLLDQLARTAADNTGQEMYTRIYVNLPFTAKDKFHKTRLEWPRMKQGFEEMGRRYPDSVWNHNIYAAYACLANDAAAAQAALAMVKGKLLSDNWFNNSAWMRDCVDWAVADPALQGSDAPPLRQ